MVILIPILIFAMKMTDNIVCSSDDTVEQLFEPVLHYAKKSNVNEFKRYISSCENVDLLCPTFADISVERFINQKIYCEDMMKIFSQQPENLGLILFAPGIFNTALASNYIVKIIFELLLSNHDFIVKWWHITFKVLSAPYQDYLVSRLITLRRSKTLHSILEMPQFNHNDKYWELIVESIPRTAECPSYLLGYISDYEKSQKELLLLFIKSSQILYFHMCRDLAKQAWSHLEIEVADIIKILSDVDVRKFKGISKDFKTEITLEDIYNEAKATPNLLTLKFIKNMIKLYPKWPMKFLDRAFSENSDKSYFVIFRLFKLDVQESLKWNNKKFEPIYNPRSTFKKFLMPKYDPGYLFEFPKWQKVILIDTIISNSKNGFKLTLTIGPHINKLDARSFIQNKIGEAAKNKNFDELYWLVKIDLKTTRVLIDKENNMKLALSLLLPSALYFVYEKNEIKHFYPELLEYAIETNDFTLALRASHYLTKDYVYDEENAFVNKLLEFKKDRCFCEEEDTAFMEITNCKHGPYHTSCLDKLDKNLCPHCRSEKYRNKIN